MDRNSWLWLPAVLVGGLIGVMLLGVLQVNFKITPGEAKDSTIAYADLAAVILSGVSVMVAILATFIGALAIWGYSQFERSTKSASENHIEKIILDGKLSTQFDEIITKYFEKQMENGKLQEIIRNKMDMISITDAGKRAAAEGGAPREKPFND